MITSYTGEIRENPIHDSQHVPEFRRIAKEEIELYTPQICTQLINEAVNAMIGAMQYDIETTMTIAFQDLEGMFKSSAARQFVSDKIIQVIKSQLEAVKIEI